jgi:cytoskeletal protein CcmA (bactofilin family)
MFTKKPEREPETSANPLPANGPDKPAAPEAGATNLPLKMAETAKGLGNMVPSIIGEDLTVTGNIVSKGEVQIEGEIQGDIHCSSLVIGDKAQVTGGVVADDVVVRGRIVGSIRGLRVTLQASSHVEGDIYHQSLAIEQGAFFEGKSRRADDATAVAPEASGGKSTSSASGGTDKADTESASKTPRAAE